MSRAYELVEEHGTPLNALKAAVVVHPNNVVLHDGDPILALAVTIELITLALMEQQEQIDAHHVQTVPDHERLEERVDDHILGTLDD